MDKLTVQQIKKLTIQDLKDLRNWVDQMYWDWDRMSSSGQETLDKIADRLGLETSKEVEAKVQKQIENLEERNPTWTREKVYSEALKLG